MEKSNNKHHFEISVLLHSTSFPPLSGPEGRKKKKKTKQRDPAGDAAPFHLLLRPVQFVADSREASEGCMGGREGGRGCVRRREEILVNVTQMILASEAVDMLLLPGRSERSCHLFGRPPPFSSSVRPSVSVPARAPSAFPCSISKRARRRRLPWLLLRFVLSVLVVKSCTCLFQIQYPVS